ncbi:MAG: hypothetical protein WDM96_17550 [Lacunisphaera sp.]
MPANGSAAAGGTATAYAAIIGGGSGGADLIKSLSQPFFIPKALQAFTYDDDGNLTQDGVWDYQYDAENRLVAMQNRSEAIGAGMIAGADARRLEFKYDYKNRRVRKTVHGGWNGSTYATTLSDTKFLYDGANLIAGVRRPFHPHTHPFLYLGLGFAGLADSLRRRGRIASDPRRDAEQDPAADLRRQRQRGCALERRHRRVGSGLRVRSLRQSAAERGSVCRRQSVPLFHQVAG